MITYVLATGSRAQALRLQQILSQSGIKGQLINTPIEAGLGCGISIEISGEYLARARTALQCETAHIKATFRCERQGYKRFLTKL